MIVAIAAAALTLATGGPDLSQTFDPSLNRNFKAKEIKWTHIPTSDELYGLYPTDALHKDILGAVTVRCHIHSDGALGECEVVEEAPVGQGFGAATIRVAAFFRAPAAAYGPEATVDIPMRWQTAPR